MAQYRAITEGFDLYNGWNASNGIGAASVWSRSGPAAIETSMVAGRFAGQALFLGAASGATPCYAYRPTAHTSMVSMGVAIKIGNSSVAHAIIEFRAVAGIQLALNQTSTGALTITRGSTVLAASDISMLPTGQWAYVEFSSAISNTTGTTSVRINGFQIDALTLSSVDTQNQSNSFVDFIYLGADSASDNTFDDLYVEVDGTTHIGEGRMWTGRVVSDIEADFTPSTGSLNYANVDEVPVVATDYNSSDVLGARDTFQVADLDFDPAQIYGVQITLNATKDEAGPRAMKNILISGVTEQLGSQFVLALSANNWHNDFWPRNPDTDAPWTISDVNALKIGYEISA